VVLLLRGARRPTWEWITVPVILRLLPHLYLGVPALGTALTAAGAIYLYTRHHRILPLIAAHFLYDWQVTRAFSHLSATLNDYAALTMGIFILGIVCEPRRQPRRRAEASGASTAPPTPTAPLRS
ncbi:hypothetical protein ACFU99_06925, partial [Streptomyces sp. NPDC057654]|uniref:hypothetical protein n=1 Tax=Streptomyces sp. NPDC057654 TaxID=3346196 RepID=UPI0036CAD842